MTQPIISVENLSKVYRLGLKEEMPDTLLDAFTGMVRSPWKKFHQLRSLSRFEDDQHQDDDVLWALKDVSFEVNEGEVLGIIGRNGAGKSTLLKVLSQITEPSAGRVVMRGRVSSLLEVGTGFHPELTGRENVYMNGTILGMRKREIDRKFDEIVDFSGVEKFLDTPVKRYSSGMKVRLAFAVAAHLEPEILIIDEVLAVGDAEFQKKCLGKMKDVAGQGRTVLFVSHNMAAVRELCENAVFLKNGMFDMRGNSYDVIEKYLSDGQLSLNGELEIIRPEDEKGDASITKVKLTDENGNTGSTYKITSEIAIDIDFELSKETRDVMLCVHLKSETDGILLNTTEIDYQLKADQPLPDLLLRKPGRYSAKVTLPTPLLNEGHFYIEPILFIPRVRILDHGPKLKFTIEDPCAVSSKVFQTARKGPIYLPLHWDIKYCGR